MFLQKAYAQSASCGTKPQDSQLDDTRGKWTSSVCCSVWASEHQLHPGITSDHDLPSHVSNSWWFRGNWRKICFSSSKAPMGAQGHWEVMLLIQNCWFMGTWRAIRAALSFWDIQRRMFQQCLRLRGATAVVLLNPFLKHVQERGTSSGQ